MIGRFCVVSIVFCLAALVGCDSAGSKTAAGPDRPGDPRGKTAPDEFRVKFETTAGDFVVEVRRDWAPRGADRFYELVTSGFYDDARFFRVVPGFVVQFGMSGDPAVQRKWDRKIADDRVTQSNKRGTITFATSGPDSRTTQVFINYGDNSRLDGLGFAPFGKVVEGMDAVDKINAEYGERPQQPRIEAEGNTYLKREFPRLDHIKSAKVLSREKNADEADKENAEQQPEESGDQGA